MQVLSVRGPAVLDGTVEVRGAKNSVLKLMAATLLAPGRSRITNVPRILDVSIMCELLQRLGCGIAYDAAAGTLPSDCGGTPAVPRAVYVDSPALDIRHVYSAGDPYAGQGSKDTAVRYLGGTPDGVPERADFVTSANHVTDASQPTMIVRSDHDRLVPPASYDAFRAAAREHGVALTEQVRRHADHASALSAHGVWNQNLLATMQRFFTENGADA